VTAKSPGWAVHRHRAGLGRRLVLAAGVAVALAAAVVLGGVSAAASGLLRKGAGPEASWQAPVAGKVDPARPGPSAPAPAGTPTRVRIPAIGVDAPLDDLHLDEAGTLAAPKEYQVPGWYADGTPPGDIGPAVIAGHVDSRTGPAVFYRLAELKAGDRVEVARGGRWLAFRVVSVDRVPKDRFPTARVYGPTPDRQLRLITCGGGFDESRLSYLDNVVVFAVAV
jgi:LPXTG-site transpeptidase (sortase) family protein